MSELTVKALIQRLQEPDIDPEALIVNLDSVFTGDVAPGYYNDRSPLPWSGTQRGGKNEIRAVHIGFLPHIARRKIGRSRLSQPPV